METTLTNAIAENDVVIYRERTYRVTLVSGKMLQIYPTPNVITPRDRERGPITVAAKNVTR